jgi:16S rRNA (uracil1498-N3)-methyltransferase
LLRLSVQAEPGVNRAELRPDQLRYLMQVMRRRPGERLIALLPDGPRMAVLQDDGFLELGEAVALAPPARPAVVLAQALLKGDHWAEMADRATQAGVARLTPILTARTVVRDVGAERTRRWTRVIEEAAEQCGRADIPTLEPLVSLPALPPVGPLVVLVPGAPLLTTVFDDLGRPPALTLVVGPEGGLTDAEIAALRARGAVPGGLGARILRAENAGPFATFLLTASSG